MTLAIRKWPGIWWFFCQSFSITLRTKENLPGGTLRGSARVMSKNGQQFVSRAWGSISKMTWDCNCSQKRIKKYWPKAVNMPIPVISKFCISNTICFYLNHTIMALLCMLFKRGNLKLILKQESNVKKFRKRQVLLVLSQCKKLTI